MKKSNIRNQSLNNPDLNSDLQKSKRCFAKSPTLSYRQLRTILIDFCFLYGNEHLHNKHKTTVTWYHDYYGARDTKKSNN